MRSPCGVFSSDHLMRQIGDVGIVLHRLTDRFGGMGKVAVLGRTGLELLVGASWRRRRPG